MIAPHVAYMYTVAKYLFFIALDEVYHDTARFSFVVQACYPKIV